MGPLVEEPGERGERFVDKDKVALVVVHESTHGAVGIVVVYEEAGHDEVDGRKIELFVSADQSGEVADLVFRELLRAKSESRGGQVIDPNMFGMAAEDESFSAHSCPQDKGPFSAEDVGILGQPIGEDCGGVPAAIIVNIDTMAHLGHDLLLYPRMGEVHEEERFGADRNRLEKGREHSGGVSIRGVRLNGSQ